MTRQVLLNILEELGKDDFSSFKFHLKDSTIPWSKLEDAKRTGAVNLMIETYTTPGAVEVTEKILKKIKRNDLVQKLAETSPTTEGQSQEEINMMSQ